MSCRVFRVRGRVQGVWFRESTRRQAEAHGITGHAVNLPDGSVEVLACGPRAALEALGRWLHEGPPMAEVESVDSAVVQASCPEGFATG